MTTCAIGFLMIGCSAVVTPLAVRLIMAIEEYIDKRIRGGATYKL
jgi:hypothetical protein